MLRLQIVMDRTLSDYYRCPEEFAKLETAAELAADSGFFQFGQGVICYGQFLGASSEKEIGSRLPDALPLVEIHEDRFRLPFDLAQVASNLRYERYLGNSNNHRDGSPTERL